MTDHHQHQQQHHHLNGHQLSENLSPAGRKESNCVRCRNHGLRITLKGHKTYCPYSTCTCDKCRFTAEQQRQMRLQNAIRRAEMHDKSDVRQGRKRKNSSNNNDSDNVTILPQQSSSSSSHHHQQQQQHQPPSQQIVMTTVAGNCNTSSSTSSAGMSPLLWKCYGKKYQFFSYRGSFINVIAIAILNCLHILYVSCLVPRSLSVAAFV